MKKLVLIPVIGLLLSGCTVATVQSGSLYPSYPRYSAPSTYYQAQPAYRYQARPMYTYQQPVYTHQRAPRCHIVYDRGYYGPQARRVCY